MKTANAVENGRITNEGLGGIYRRTQELARRIEQGNLDYDWVMDQLQVVIQGFKLLPNTETLQLTIGSFKGREEVEEFVLKNIEKGESSPVGDLKNKVSTLVRHPDFEISSTIQTLKIVFLNTYQLGFSSGTKFGSIIQRALDLGLTLCPSEVGIELFKQMQKDQLGRLGGSVRVAMQPIHHSWNEERVSGNVPLVFDIQTDDQQSEMQLHTHEAWEHHMFSIPMSQSFAFVVPHGLKTSC